MAMVIQALRPDDLLNLRFEGMNLRLDTTDPDHPVIVLDDPSSDAFLLVFFPPQAIEEQAFFQASNLTKPPGDKVDYHPDAPPPATLPQPGAVLARLSQESRLVFRIPAGTDLRMPYSLAGLLDWSGLLPSVAPLADISEALDAQTRTQLPLPQAPAPTETAIEFPYRLQISPNSRAVWEHAVEAVIHQGRAELWHTRLSLPGEAEPEALSEYVTAPLRVLWSPDYNPTSPPQATQQDAIGLTAMSPYDRHQLVTLTTDVHNYIDDNRDSYTPSPVQATQLMLTPLGAWLRSRGSWMPPFKALPPRIIQRPGRGLLDNIALDIAVQARSQVSPQVLQGGTEAVDASARVRELGNLAIEQHAEINISDWFKRRKGQQLDLSEWVHSASQGRDHYVRIVYEGYLYPFGHRAALIKVTERRFRTVAINNVQTPVAYLIQRMYVVVRQPSRRYPIPVQGASPLPLQQIELKTRVTPDISFPYAPPAKITNDGSFWILVNNAPFSFNCVGTDLSGQQIGFTAALVFVPNSEATAPSSTGRTAVASSYRGSPWSACTVAGVPVAFTKEAGNSLLTTQTFHFDSTAADTLENLFKPRLDHADVLIPAVQRLLGTTQATSIKYYTGYLNGDPANVGQVFAESISPLPLAFNANQAGGFATPNLGITTLSQSLGPLGGTVAEAAQNTFNPANIFPKAGAAKLFGVIDLMDLLASQLGAALGDRAPQMTSRQEGANAITELHWSSPVTDEPSVGILTFRKQDSTALEITATVTQPLNGAPPSSVMHGELRDFTLDFAGVLLLDFSAFGFRSTNGEKLDLSVDLNSVTPLKFAGALEFVDELRRKIPPALFGDGPSLDITPQEIRAGFELALPPLAVAVFALKDVSLSAALILPFRDGKPLFEFSFCERQRPFLLTVALFGGGGFFRLQLDTERVRLLEAALEFGAAIELNLGVASGGVHVMAGFYFAYKVDDQGQEAAVLSGYFRCGGELSVLGLISVSLEFNLSLTYYPAGPQAGKVAGRATLTVKVEIAFFSVSVDLTVEKSFGKDGGDPVFAQIYDSADVWAEYANAFA